ncbi:MAG: fibronectin type III domain-containing protein [Thermoguttaceae bacterium]|nr:fibronectin type III domain-containing protein [Thermoguttaceae bacterium]
MLDLFKSFFSENCQRAPRRTPKTRSCRIDILEERTLLSTVPFSGSDLYADTYFGADASGDAAQPVTLDDTGMDVPVCATPEAAMANIPEGYCANDVTRLRDFLEQTNEGGQKNGTLINPDYNADDPSTWAKVKWVETDSGKQAVDINWAYYSLTGSLDLSGCSALKYLNCGWNQLEELNVSGCTSLETLVCCENLLESLDVSENLALDSLDCWNNQIEELDVSNNTAMTYLVCFGNEMTTLDVSQNDQLGVLWCWNEDLTNVALSQTAFSNGMEIGLYGSQTTWSCLNAEGETVLSGITVNDPFTPVAFPFTLVADSGSQTIEFGECFTQLDAPVVNQPTVSGRKVFVSWDAVPNAVKYVMEYWTADDEEVSTKTVSGTSSSFNASYGDLCYVRVMALGSGFWTDSEFSATASVQVPTQLTGVTLSTSEAAIGQTITAEVAPAGATVEWQWFRGDEEIEGATESAYTVTFEDVGFTLKCQATGTDLYTGTVISAATEMVTGPLSTPTLSLQPENYEVLVTSGEVAKAPGYIVEYSLDYGFADSQTVEFSTAGTHAIEGLEHDQVYYFRVMAIGSESTGTADSDWSEVKSAFNFGISEVESAPTIVTTSLDVVDAHDGIISLREALSYAPTGATITFDESMHDQTITLDGSPLQVVKNVNIQDGGHNITIDADGRSSVMYVNASATIQGLALTNGWSAGNSSAGVQVDGGTVTFRNCEISGNVNESTSSKSGAAVYVNSAATLRLESSVIRGNTDRTINSAAIFSTGKLTMLSCEVTQNDAAGVFGQVNPMNIVNCTIVGNSHQGISTTIPKTTVTNSIVAGNFVYDVQGKCTMTNSIVGTVETTTKPTLKKTQTGIRNAGFVYLPDFANYEEWLNACEEDWDLALMADSIAINLGDAKLLTNAGNAPNPTDVEGNRRISYRIVDIGAHEFQYESLESPEVTACIDGKNVYVAWEAVDGAVTYTVDYRIAGAAKWTTKKGIKTNFMTFGAKAGTTYEICVTAVSPSLPPDDSAASTTFATCTQTLANLKLKTTYQGDDNATVSVTGLAANATHLLVKLGNSRFQIPAAGGSATVGDVECTFQNGTLVFTGLKNVTKYPLEVQQMIDEPGATLVRSAVAKANIQTTKACYNTPENVTAVTVSDTQVEVSWSAVTGKNSTQEAAFYTVQYSIAGTNKWSNATAKAVGTSFVVSKLKAGTKYDFRVFASKDNSFLASGFSSSASAVTMPAAPKIASVTSSLAKTAVFNWSGVSGASKYEIRYSVQGSDNWVVVDVWVTSNMSFSRTISGLTSGKAYEFQIRCFDNQMKASAWSVSKVLASVK